MRLKKLSGLGLVFAIGLAACDDSAGPSAEFDPVESAADLQAVDNAFETPVFQSLGAMGGLFAIQGAPALSTQLIRDGWHLTSGRMPTTMQQVGERMVSALLASSGQVVLIPESFRGRTYVHDPVEGYFWDQSRTGAPANGIRYILNAVNPVNGEPTADEIGHVDITDESTDLTAIARLVVVSEEVEYINYTVSATGLIGSLSIAIEGYVSDGTDRVDLDLAVAMNATFATSSVSVTYNLDVPTRDFSISASLTMDFNGETQSGTITPALPPFANTRSGSPSPSTSQHATAQVWLRSIGMREAVASVKVPVPSFK